MPKFQNPHECSKGRGKKNPAYVFQGLIFYFKFDFLSVLFVLHHYHKQNAVAMAMLIEFVGPALGLVLWAVSTLESKEEGDIKELEDPAHLLF